MRFQIGQGGHIPRGCVEVFIDNPAERLFVREVRTPWQEFEVVEQFDDPTPLASFYKLSEALAEAAFYISH